MAGTIIETIILCWVGYTVWRVFSSKQNAVKVSAQVLADCPLEFAFSTYMQVREYYLRLSPGHKKYEMSGTDLTKDVVIDVWETAGFQFVQHRYHITEMATNKRMKLVSEKSTVKIMGVFKGKSRSEIEFRFQPTSSGKTRLSLTIWIIFPHWLRHFMARLFFTEAIWRSHALEEMATIAGIMDERYTASEPA